MVFENFQNFKKIVFKYLFRFEPDCGSLNVSKVEPIGVIAEETILKLDTEKVRIK